MLDKMIDALIVFLQGVKQAYKVLAPSIQLHLASQYLAPNVVAGLQIAGYGLALFFFLKGEIMKGFGALIITSLLIG